jgi:hypothetical protein
MLPAGLVLLVGAEVLKVLLEGELVMLGAGVAMVVKFCWPTAEFRGATVVVPFDGDGGASVVVPFPEVLKGTDIGSCP